MRPKHLLNYFLLATLILLSYSSCKKKSDDSQSEGNQSTITKEIAGLATVTFPVGSLQSGDPVLTQAQDTAEISCFGLTMSLFAVSANLPNQIKVNIGNAEPLSDDITINWTVPAEFLQSLPDSAKLMLFARLYQNGGEEALDNYVSLVGAFNSATSVFTAALPYWIFTNARRTDGTYEAILMLGATGGNKRFKSQNFQAHQGGNGIKSPSDDPCQGSNLMCPAGTCTSSEISSPFTQHRLHPKQHVVKPHTGIDIAVEPGSDVRASADGIVIWIKVDYRIINGIAVGYGQYMIVWHYDGSTTLYAHLSKINVNLYDVVSRGQVIAQSGGGAGDENSGGSTGPHLHFEYVPKGDFDFIGKRTFVNPFPCITSAPALPIVETAGVANITTTSATSGGNVLSDGGAAITMRGVCWNISGNPTISNWHSSDGPGTGTFTSQLSGLSPKTTYFLRAYATNEAGTAYGDITSFITDDAAGLNGLWTNGSIVISIDGSTGAFNQILSGMWLQALGAGYISIGSAKIANITASVPGKWNCNELWWHSTGGNIDGVAFSPDGSIVLVDAKNFQLTSSNPWTGGSVTTGYTRVGQMSTPIMIVTEKPGAVAGK